MTLNIIDRETIRNFMWRALQILAKQGVNFSIFVICAKNLSPYNFGTYVYLLATISFILILGDFGVSTATSKFVAEYNATDTDKLRLVLFNSGTLIIALGLIVTVVTVFFGDVIFGEKKKLILYILPMIFLVPLTSLYDGIYRGLKKFKALSIISLSVGSFSLIIVYLIVKNYGLKGALIAQSLFYFMLLMSLAVGYREFHFRIDARTIKEVAKYSTVVGISSIGYFLYSRVDILILGQFGYIKEVSYYEIINQMFILLCIPITILSQVIAPRITTLAARDDFSEIVHRLKQYSMGVIPLSIIITTGLAYVFPSILRMIFPGYFKDIMMLAFTILIFLLPAKIWGVFLAQGFITSTGFAKILAVSTLIGGVLNVISDYILISAIGFVGVFYSTLIIHGISIIVVSIIFVKKLKNRERPAGVT